MTEQEDDSTTMSKPGKRGLRRLIAATGYSIKGFQAAWRNEEAFRSELLLCVALVPLAFWLGQTTVEQLLLLGSLIFVISAELGNTAIESVVDRVSTEQHPLSGQAKDLGSAIVLVSNLNVLLVWGMIAYDRFCG